MKKILIIALMLILALGQTGGRASAQAEELVTNGNFEFPVVDTSLAIWNIYPDGTEGLGWHLEWYDGALEYMGTPRPELAYIEYHNPGALWSGYEGNQYAELDSDWPGPSGALNGEPASLRIYQDVQTCNGGAYELKYAWSPRLLRPENIMEVWWGDTLLNTHAAAGGPDNVWTLETVSLTASDSSTRLAFVETGTANGLGMLLDAVSVIQTQECTKEVRIDITPGKYPNIIRLSSTKMVAVAVLGSADFDVHQIDKSTLVFAGLHVGINSYGNLRCVIYDLSGDFTSPAGAPDGYLDLRCLFKFVRSDFTPNPDGTATLTGALYDGTVIEGRDSVTIRP